MSKKVVVILAAVVLSLLSTASTQQANRVDYLSPGEASITFVDGQYYLSITGSYQTSCPGRETVRFIRRGGNLVLQIFKTSVIKKADMAYCDGAYYPGMIDQATGCGCNEQYAQYVIQVNQ